MTPLRRVLVLVAFAFWQGGFAFYTAVVVPLGTEVLGSAAAQGFITRRVSYWMNVAGAVALLPLGWDVLATAPYRRWRAVFWLVLVALLVGLFAMHPRLDALLDAQAERVLDRRAFGLQHRLYLWLSTVQFFAGVAYLVLTPLAWRAADRGGRDA
jgi:hypothetical protein